MGNDLTDDQVNQIRLELLNGRKLEAVKLYKEDSGASLKESKEFIEQLMEELQVADPSAVTSQSGCGAVILLAVVLGLGVLLGAV